MCNVLLKATGQAVWYSAVLAGFETNLSGNLARPFYVGGVLHGA